ncbi:bucentaur or craniofacial development-domain-containing protein [Trametes maxima]|nr:bucentaur or craniofacial development-domain-containing protein [Trametes maxima]
MDVDSDDDSDYAQALRPAHVNAPAPTSHRRQQHPRRIRQISSAPRLLRSRIRSGDEVYAAFKASLSAPPPPPPPATSSASAATQTVKIVKRYRFAGEEVTEVKEVPADSQEAKEWPRWTSSDENPAPPPVSEQPSASGAGPGPATAAASSSSASSVKPPGKRPGPRKPKTTLAPIPKKQAVKKLSTLDKSAMDWRAHVEGEAAPEVKDELEANRRGGGYLEKVEFLQRVEARKEEVLDANKGKRRR